MNDDLSIYQMKITTFPIENFIMHSEKYILKINSLNSKDEQTLNVRKIGFLKEGLIKLCLYNVLHSFTNSQHHV